MTTRPIAKGLLSSWIGLNLAAAAAIAVFALTGCGPVHLGVEPALLILGAAVASLSSILVDKHLLAVLTTAQLARYPLGRKADETRANRLRAVHVCFLMGIDDGDPLVNSGMDEGCRCHDSILAYDIVACGLGRDAEGRLPGIRKRSFASSDGQNAIFRSMDGRTHNRFGWSEPLSNYGGSFRQSSGRCKLWWILRQTQRGSRDFSAKTVRLFCYLWTGGTRW